MRLLSALGVAVLLGLIGCAAGTDADSAGPDAGERAPHTRPADWPDPPRIPDDFSWSGRYLVPDLGIEVPFTWNGANGDFQMIAGGEDHPIHFTNLIVAGELYTLTYEWPDVSRMPCSHVGAFTLDELNAGFAEASFAGRERLYREDAAYEVNHFRSVAVFDLPAGTLGEAADLPLRVPLMAGDIYVDIEGSEQVRQLLHFGLQNLYDPNLDEWILIDQGSREAGEVALPKECVDAG